MRFCMVRPLQVAVLLLSVHPLPDQCLLHLHPMQVTDFPSTCPGPQLVIVFIKGAVRGVLLYWFPR